MVGITKLLCTKKILIKIVANTLEFEKTNIKYFRLIKLQIQSKITQTIVYVPIKMRFVSPNKKVFTTTIYITKALPGSYLIHFHRNSKSFVKSKVCSFVC